MCMLRYRLVCTGEPPPKVCPCGGPHLFSPGSDVSMHSAVQCYTTANAMWNMKFCYNSYNRLQLSTNNLGLDTVLSDCQTVSHTSALLFSTILLPYTYFWSSA